MTSRIKLALAVLVISVLLLASMLVLTQWKRAEPSIPQHLAGVLRPFNKPIGEFELRDQHGVTFDQARLLGRWSFVFFGYTYCPDICPTTLAVLSAVQKQLKQAPEVWSDTQVVFASVDPARDTQEKLSSYMDFFNKEFLALTGSKEQIDELVHQFSAAYIIEEETSPGQYLVSHSASIFLSDPKGQLVASFSMPHNPATIASLFRDIRALY